MESPEHFPIELAKEAIAHFLHHQNYIPVPANVPEPFKKQAGVFVTLKKEKILRGCIGTVFPKASSISEEIIQNAVSSATRDPRFPPVTLDELSYLSYSVSVLTPFLPVRSLEELDPKTYGVIVQSGMKSGVLLPGIPEITTVEQQLAIVRQKAGIGPNEKIQIHRFQTTVYE